MNQQELDRELDKVKLKIFTFDKFSGFYGSLMCTLDHNWNETDCDTACTDGLSIDWNPKFFLALTPDQRLAVHQHEIEHVARLHMLRGEGLDPETWNQACDYVINLDLKERGYAIDKVKGVLLDKNYAGMAEEEVYALLKKNKTPPKKPFGGNTPDIKQSKATPTQVLGKVIQARDMAKLASGGKPGTCPGDIEEYIEALLKPKVDWKSLLSRFHTDLVPGDYTFARPNRRMQAHGMYLPSQDFEANKLSHLMYFFDVSGSMSQEDVECIVTELKHVKDTFNPEKITLAQFDTAIRDVLVIEEHDTFNGLKVIGRGGTDLSPVHAMIEAEKPTAAVIFTDMGCAPMNPLSSKTPVFWVVLNNPHAPIPFGEAVFIDTFQ